MTASNYLIASSSARHCWAVMLAGGDGTRLRSLTLKIAGDSRPKQFCFIISGESLLAQTRARLEPLFHVDRERFVVTRAHETYYREELRDVDDSRIILQTLNRVTGVAVAVALLHILQRDDELKRVRDYLHHLFLRLLIRMPMSFEIERLVSWENAVVRRVRTRLPTEAYVTARMHVH